MKNYCDAVRELKITGSSYNYSMLKTDQAS